MECFCGCFSVRVNRRKSTQAGKAREFEPRSSTGFSGETLQDGDDFFVKRKPCMDPFSILAGVVGIATAGVQGSKKLYELLDDVRSGPDEIFTISQDAHALFAVMHSLEIALKREDLQALVQDDDEIIDAVENLQQPLRNCQRILTQLMDEIAGRLKPHPDGDGYRLSSYDLKWGMVTKGHVRNIMRRLDSNKATLNTGMGAITTIVSVRMQAQGKDHVAREIKRSSGATDAGYALRRYLAESVVGPDDFVSQVEWEPSLKLASRPPTPSPSSHTLVETQADKLAKSQRQRDELHDAARTGDSVVTARLIAEGADINMRGMNGTVALFLALENNHEHVALELLEHDCDIDVRFNARNDAINAKFVDGRTPLIFAADKGFDRVVRKLIHMGQDVNLQNSGGRTALQEAIHGKHVSTAQILLEESDPNIELSDNECWTPLLQCADQGMWQIAKMLIERGANLEARSSETNIWGWRKFMKATALLIALESPHTEMVKVLCEAGADVNVQNVDHEMPIHMAVRVGNLGMVKAVMARGVDPNVYTLRMETPLMVAIAKEHVEIVECLVNNYPECKDFEFENQYGPKEMAESKARVPGVNVAVRLAMQGLVNGSLGKGW